MSVAWCGARHSADVTHGEATKDLTGPPQCPAHCRPATSWASREWKGWGAPFSLPPLLGGLGISTHTSGRDNHQPRRRTTLDLWQTKLILEGRVRPQRTAGSPLAPCRRPGRPAREHREFLEEGGSRRNRAEAAVAWRPGRPAEGREARRRAGPRGRAPGAHTKGPEGSRPRLRARSDRRAWSRSRVPPTGEQSPA